MGSLRVAHCRSQAGAEFTSIVADAGDAGPAAETDFGIWRAGGRAGAAYGSIYTHLGSTSLEDPRPTNTQQIGQY